MARWFSRATVNGSFSFPTDMLRYDSCWPADPDTVGVLTDRETQGGMTAKLIRSGASKADAENWTKARWASFGWVVMNIETWRSSG